MFMLTKFTMQEALRSSDGEVLFSCPQKEYVALYNDEVISEEEVDSAIQSISAGGKVPDEIIVLSVDVWNKLHDMIISYFSSVLGEIEADVRAKIKRSPIFKLKSFEQNRNDAFLEVLDIIKWQRRVLARNKGLCAQ